VLTLSRLQPALFVSPAPLGPGTCHGLAAFPPPALSADGSVYLCLYLVIAPAVGPWRDHPMDGCLLGSLRRAGSVRTI